MKTVLAFLVLVAAAPAAAADMARPVAADSGFAMESVMPGGAPARPAIVTALATLRAGTILSAGDLMIDRGDADAMSPLVGMQLKRTVYAGKPVTSADVGPPVVVERNAMVTLEFQRGPLVITTEGRALDAGAVGEAVRVMNLNSKIVLTAVVTGPNKAMTR